MVEAFAVRYGRWIARLTIERDAEERARRSRPFAIRLDGEPWLRVSSEELAELGVIDGDDVDDRRRAELETALARVRARLFVVRSLSARAQSVAEIERKLAERGIPVVVAREAIELAAGYGYLDDAALAGQLARGMRERGYGRRRAVQTLRSRGVPSEVAECALDEAYGEADETALARAALGRRVVEGDAGRRKAVGFLVRRGFSSGVAWTVVREGERDVGR